MITNLNELIVPGQASNPSSGNLSTADPFTEISFQGHDHSSMEITVAHDSWEIDYRTILFSRVLTVDAVRALEP